MEDKGYVSRLYLEELPLLSLEEKRGLLSSTLLLSHQYALCLYVCYRNEQIDDIYNSPGLETLVGVLVTMRKSAICLSECTLQIKRYQFNKEQGFTNKLNTLDTEVAI